MNLFVMIFSVLLLLSSVTLAAGPTERIALHDLTDSKTNELFRQLARFRTPPHEAKALVATESALEALLADLSPQIIQLPDYTGIFTANCSVYFNDAIEQADCDVNLAHSRSLVAGAEFVPAHQLSEQYRHPITQSNILLTNIFADWTDGQTQEFISDLYFRRGSCSETLSATLGKVLSNTLSETPSKSLLKTLMWTLSPTKTETLSATKELHPTPSLSASSTQSPTVSRRLIPSSTLSGSSTQTETITGTKKLRQTRSLTPSLSLSGEPVSSPSQTRSQLVTQTLTRKTPPPTPVPTPAPPVCSPAPPVSGLLAAWSQSGGTYQDGTSQPSRYSVLNTVVTDSFTGMQWQQTASASPMNWTAAATYCSEQTTGGLSGWRVPNIGELGTLLDYTISSPTVPINAGAFPGTPAISFWSSSPVIGYAGSSWDVWLGDYGASYWDPVATLDNVRCVRSCYPTPPVTRYTIASGIVTDTVTGLIWQQHSPTTGGPNSNGTYPFSPTAVAGSAQAYCAELGLGTYSWRLPTIKELATLVDYNISQGGLMMDAIAFAGEPVYDYWSSTAVVGSPSGAWGVGFNSGGVGYGYGVDSFLAVRCVAHFAR